ncbi:AraC family transcriptional regulator ligand-binding domain-containing protein [Achromobacter sp. NPDC058515]|uniref:AraC family transcriptional regulator n=1 Tax=Achromobacter sp. NPDC058515 TaxID=3346533 RepID=UPI00364F0407
MFVASSRQPDQLVSAVLRRAGVDQKSLDDPSLRLTVEQFASFLVGLSRRSRDEFWGLASKPVPLGTFKVLCRMLVTCTTLGEALNMGSLFYRLVLNDFAVRTRTHGGRTTVQLVPSRSMRQSSGSNSALLGAAVFILYQLLCWLADKRLPLESIEFSFAPLPHSAEPLRIYQTQNVHFERKYTALHFNSGLLSLPIIGDKQRLAGFLAAAPRSLIARYHDQSRMVDKVVTLVRRNLASNPSLETIARQLNTTPVSLHRRLAEEESTSFSQIRDQVRYAIALDLLNQPRFTLEQIASRLGFAEHSTFHRAFKRWTGLAPGEFRSKAKTIS